MQSWLQETTTSTNAQLVPRKAMVALGNGHATITIQLHPFCEMCLRSGRYTQATEVHHVLPISQGGTNAQDNLMSLCKPCHSRITAEMDDRWHHRPQTYHYWREGRSKSLLASAKGTGVGLRVQKIEFKQGITPYPDS